MSSITNALVRRWRVSAKDGFAELGTVAVSGEHLPRHEHG
jgi:hypothetical protein